MRRRIMSGMGLFITLFLGVNTFLCFLSKAEALTILDKFPIAVTADNEFGFYGAFDGTNYLVGVGGDLGLGKDLDLACPITAQLVSRSGALLGSRISVGRTGGMGQVAFDGTNYLMVWDDGPADDTGDVHSYGQFISKTGTLVGVPFPISSPSGHSSHQYLGWVRSIAFDGTNYLVVWDNSSDDRYSDDGSYVGDIYGQFVSTSGVLGTKIPIATTTTRGSFSVAFDGTRYLMVWMNRRSGSPERYDVYGKFITKGGELSSPFTISVRGNPSARFNPMDILFDGADYLVVWNRDTGPGYPSSSMWDIYGRKVSPDGSLGPEVPLVTSPGDQVVPTVLFDGTNYFSTWNDGKTGVVVGRLFNTSLSPVGSEFILFESTDAKVPMGGLTLFDGTRYLALVTMLKYTDKYTLDVYGRFIYTGADPYDPNGVGGTTMADVLICYKQYLGIPMSIDYPLADVDGGGVTMRDVLKIYKRYLGLS